MSEFIPNKYKIIDLKLGSKEWKEAVFGAANVNKYIAQGLVLSAGENDQISFSASSHYNAILDNLFKKLRNSTMGRVVTGLAELSQAAAAMGVTENLIRKELGILPPKARFQTTLARLPAWESTDPVEIGSFKFRFQFGMAGAYNGRTEVYNPALALWCVNQPIKSGGFLFGPTPGPAYAYGTVAAQLVKTLQSNALNSSYDLESNLSAILRSAEDGLLSKIKGERGAVDLTWGQFKFPTFYVENTKINFSKETDTNGFPIYAEVSWEGCKTLQVAHWGLIPFKDDSPQPADVTSDTLKMTTVESQEMISTVQAEYEAGAYGGLIV